MRNTSIRSELREIANNLPKDATYEDAMYQMYVRMKIASGRSAVKNNEVYPHKIVKENFLK